MNAAVCIETRALESFPETVRSHMHYLKGWELVIFGSDDNEYFLTRNISNFVLHKLHYPFYGQFEANLTLTSPKFWKPLLHYERVLIFQHDSGILREGIDEFLEWDFVGAPWKFQHHGGNGGLSLRNPKTMYNICSKNQWRAIDGNEDVFYSNRLKGKGLAPRNVCERFSVESIFKLGTWGYHAIDAWLTPEQCAQIRAQKT